jgi:hypothetical protein
MVKGYRQAVGQPPITEYRATINGMPKDMKEPDIVKIVNDGHRAASRRPEIGSRLQRQQAAEAFPHQHRGAVRLHQGHRLRDDGEVLGA